MNHSFGNAETMRALPHGTREEAEVWLREFADWRYEQSPYGTVISTNWKPACIQFPDVFNTAEELRARYELNWWNMTAKQAERRYNVPLSVWERKRAELGIK